MLELNKYGSKGSMLDVSSFDINNTIKLVVQSFEGTCKNAGILDRNKNFVIFFGSLNGNGGIRMTEFDGVINKIVQHLLGL